MPYRLCQLSGQNGGRSRNSIVRRRRRAAKPQCGRATSPPKRMPLRGFVLRVSTCHRYSREASLPQLMPFWGLEDWKAAAHTVPVVSDFSQEQFADGCYRLALGREAIVSVEANATSGVRRNLEADGFLQLLPGQFAYLITAERVRIPDAAIGLINIATRIKLAGIVNISGFHVDPGYDGRLIFTIFNAGAQAVHLGYHERIF